MSILSRYFALFFLRLGLILPLSDASVRIAEFNEPSKILNPQSANYRFLHDRVQQAAYALIPDDEKQVVHLRVGQLMWQHSDEAALDEHLFEIVGHLNIGAALITDEAEQIRLIDMNLRAGRKAKTSTAYQPALSYFEEGVNHLPPDAWKAHYDLAFALHLERAECSYLCGHFEQAGQQLEHLLDRATSPTSSNCSCSTCLVTTVRPLGSRKKRRMSPTKRKA